MGGSLLSRLSWSCISDHRFEAANLSGHLLRVHGTMSVATRVFSGLIPVGSDTEMM